MATILQPLAPWMRDLSRFMNTPGAASAFLPPADLLVTEDDVTVYMDVPGIKADDLDIQLESDMLTMCGERRMSDGVLVMRLPQPAQTQPRRIQIRPGTTAGNGAGIPTGDPEDRV